MPTTVEPRGAFSTQRTHRPVNMCFRNPDGAGALQGVNLSRRG